MRATRYVVQFHKRSLRSLRLPRRGKKPGSQSGDPADIVADFEAAVRRDQAPFVAAIQRLGGRVTAQWWLVNGCAIESRKPTDSPWFAPMPNVRRIDLDLVRHPASE